MIFRRGVVLHNFNAALIVKNMSEMLTWPQIKERYPELAQRLRDGDMTARTEFVRLSFGAEIISETPRAPQPTRKTNKR
jgi:hypothetical protein